MRITKFHIAIFTIAVFAVFSSCGSYTKVKKSNLGLKDYYQSYFNIGVAVSTQTIKGEQGALLLKEFNSITPENAMKMQPIHPREDVYHWAEADALVNFAHDNRLKIRGHTLCWHEQAPAWIFKNSTGGRVDKNLLLKRLKDHITTVVGRYKGKVYAWDVVNEVIGDEDDQYLRPSLWQQICGEEFIAKAFEYAHEADPDALLFYNDYNSERPEKRAKIYKMLKTLVDNKVPIHGVGLQGHWSIFEPSETELRESLKLYASLGLQIQITELDMSIYQWEKNLRAKKPGEQDSLTATLEKKQIDQYARVFSIFREFKKEISSVTFWNLSDRSTWLDQYPVPGRKNYPLLFDQNLQRKKAYWGVVDFKE
ncbi:endo-1,4-beta-xylanase [Pedobacter terrae]|uniref:Beta-xylanase n=1 Tax=Pedobacter terrae TaxID=405671 RepID=A0A1G8CTB1_9SPHI|nr:endo-1,4-beta-xylanase [Pedobacter terrae]SDH48419.1 endo-1,4-beta-xylanase [Pedobacter terrae]